MFFFCVVCLECLVTKKLGSETKTLVVPNCHNLTKKITGEIIKSELRATILFERFEQFLPKSQFLTR